MDRKRSDDDQAIERAAPDDLTTDADLPVVARLVVEIRSDGTRTVARGAIEDTRSGERAQIEARGGTPAQLAIAMARSMFKLPTLAGLMRLRNLLKR
jgi:hypothetical protein